jgi:hypothetical protein
MTTKDSLRSKNSTQFDSGKFKESRMSKCEICKGDFNRGEVIAHCNNCWNKNLAQSMKEGRRLGAIEELKSLSTKMADKYDFYVIVERIKELEAEGKQDGK